MGVLLLHCCTQFCDLLVLLTDKLRDQLTVGLQLKIDREKETQPVSNANKSYSSDSRSQWWLTCSLRLAVDCVSREDWRASWLHRPARNGARVTVRTPSAADTRFSCNNRQNRLTSSLKLEFSCT